MIESIGLILVLVAIGTGLGLLIVKAKGGKRE